MNSSSMFNHLWHDGDDDDQPPYLLHPSSALCVEFGQCRTLVVLVYLGVQDHPSLLWVLGTLCHPLVQGLLAGRRWCHRF